MRLLAMTIASLLLAASSFAQTTELVIKRNGSQPSTTGPAGPFTGAVRVDPLFPAHDPGRTASGSVTFEPGARTRLAHPSARPDLIVTAGSAGCSSGAVAVQEIHPGDVVWIPPGVKHWHGATPTTAMTHFAIQEQLDGKVVDWMEKVSDEQYAR